MIIASHRDLLVWQKAIELVKRCYHLTHSFPRLEQFGLRSQLQRAAVSIPANIAEGKGRGATGAYVNHLSIASGSLAELDTHVEVAVQLGYISREKSREVTVLIEEVGRMLNGLRKSLGAHTS